MSRDSTPTSLIGALAISGSPGSSNNDMPVTTRGMRNQRHRNLAASQHASSGAAAGSSRAGIQSSAQHATARSSGRSVRRTPHRRRSARTRVEDNDADDDDSEDGDSDENPEDVVDEIMSIFTDTFLTPREFRGIRQRPTRSNVGIEQTRDCRALADILHSTVVRDPEALTVLRGGFTRQYCAARLVNNLWNRDAAITRSLYSNLENQANGRDVPDSLDDWRSLIIEIDHVLTNYWNDLSVERCRSLAGLLIKILDHIFRTDIDLYAGRNRTIYAGESSGGNLFRRFISARAEPIRFLDPLHRMDVNLLASQRALLQNLITTFSANGPNGSEAEQYNRVAQFLRAIWARATGQQL